MLLQRGQGRRVSTRRVDDLVQAMGLSGIGKSTVSKLCKDIDDRVNALLDRPLVGDCPYLWLDATYLRQRAIVGPHIGPSEAETFWATFLKSPVRRGLRGVTLVISDAHEGLKAAIRRVMWGRHGRDVAAVPRALDEERPVLRRPHPAEHGVSTHPIERVNKEVKRRADVVGIFPGEASIIRLVGAVLLDLDDEWQLQHRCMQTEAMAELAPAPVEVFPLQISTAAE